MTSSEERAWEKVSDLEDQIADIKANCDLAIEGRDIKIMELEEKHKQEILDLVLSNSSERAELEKENRLLGERCNQLLKDKGELTDQIADIKANCDYVLEGKEIEYREERNKLCADFENMKATLESKIAELEQQIEKMKCCGNCSKYDRYNRMCSRTKFSVIETLCNCSDDWELRR